jgi:hypothetical protein
MLKLLETLVIKSDSVREKELWINNDQMWATMKNKTMVEEDASSLPCFYKYFENFPIVDIFSNKNGCWKSIAKNKECDEIKFWCSKHCFWG